MLCYLTPCVKSEVGRADLKSYTVHPNKPQAGDRTNAPCSDCKCKNTNRARETENEMEANDSCSGSYLSS